MQWQHNNNNNNNCLKSNIQCIEIRVQWTVHLGSSHMHVHAVTRVHAVTPKLVICVMYLTSIWRILLMTDCFNAVWSNDRAAHTDTNPKNLELAPPQSITATRLDQLVYSPNYYIQIFQTQNNCPQWEANLHPARSESWAFATTPRELQQSYNRGESMFITLTKINGTIKCEKHRTISLDKSCYQVGTTNCYQQIKRENFIWDCTGTVLVQWLSQ